MTDWFGVRERVLALAEVPGSDEVFGARSHRYALDAPLTADEVADVEAWFGIELPEDYRSFLQEVGAGGAGPAYGLFPVQRDGSGAWLWAGAETADDDACLFDRPFPGGVDPSAVVEILAERPNRADFADLADLDAALEEWEELLAETQYDRRFTPGALCLCAEGCGLMVWLVVTGSQRGHMWRDQRCDEIDLRPMRDADASSLGFASWYLGWLAAAEATAGPAPADAAAGFLG